MGLGLTQVITALHALDAALCVHNALLAGVKGMAFTAHLNAERGFRGPGLEHVATRARHRGVVKIRVNFCFHFVLVFS